MIMNQVNKKPLRALGIALSFSALMGCTDGFMYGCNSDGRSAESRAKNFNVSFSFKQAGSGILGQDEFYRHKEMFYINSDAKANKIKKAWVCDAELPRNVSSTKYKSAWWGL